MKRRGLLGLAAISVLSGCSNVVPGWDEEEDQEQDDDGSTDPPDQQEGEAEEFPTEPVDTVQLQPTPGEVAGDYEILDEERVVTSEDHEDVLDQGVIQYHERAFSYIGDSEEYPDTVFVSVTQYDTEEAVEDSRADIINLVEEEEGAIEEDTISGLDGLRGEYRIGDNHNSIVYVTQGGIEVFAVASDSESYYPQISREIVLSVVEDCC